MASKLQKIRRQAFQAQQGRCFYCSQSVWERDIESFVKAHGVRRRLAKHVQCTAEHLKPRADGGPDDRQNIVAACLWCNSQRHRSGLAIAPAPEVYRLRVQSLIARGKWHPVAASAAALQVR